MIPQAKQWLQDARRVAVVTGAGVSAESGVPTFRGAGGLWNNFRAEDLATPEAFRRDPGLVWEWYEWRRGLIAKCEPNEGHRALVRLERAKPEFWLATQNVDGLHELAGSRRIGRIHGSIWVVRCLACGDERERREPFGELPPRCDCGGLLRPGVVWFGEALPEREWLRAEQAARECEVMLVAGTSAAVYPAAGLAPLAKRGGARVIEVNLEATALSPMADAALHGKSSEILKELIP